MNIFIKHLTILFLYTIFFNYSNISLSKEHFDSSLKNMIIHSKSKDFPTLNVKDSTGSDVKINKYHKRFTLINFWATWCAPCVEELPSLDKLVIKFGENNINIIAINVEKIKKEKAVNFLKNLKIKNFTTYFDDKFEVAKLLKLRGIPITIIINNEGREIARVVGSLEFDSKIFIDQLEKL